MNELAAAAKVNASLKGDATFENLDRLKVSQPLRG